MGEVKRREEEGGGLDLTAPRGREESVRLHVFETQQET